MILDKGEIITDDAEVAEKLINFFIEAVESLDTETFTSSTISDVYTDDRKNYKSVSITSFYFEKKRKSHIKRKI